MSHPPQPDREALSPSRLQSLDKLCDRFEAACQAGQRPRIEEYLGDRPEPERSLLLRELLGLEVEYRCQAGKTLAVTEYRQRFPGHTELVQAVIGPRVAQAVDLSAGRGSSRPSGETGVGHVPTPDAERPARLGRYRITGELGRGSFGVVYKGCDDDLRRDVALKVPHRHRLARPEELTLYLAEARVLACLDHSHIVPVYDFGRTADGSCFVVSKFIEGSDLKRTIREARPTAPEAATLVVQVADALHCAHLRGLVHRDIKPGNILLDTRGRPYVVDFGLALREEDFDTGANFAGTPAYMSPEQARGEGHRVDGRSDIFSLGVVFYELLTGRHPFRGNSLPKVLEQITSVEARPLRQVDDGIPKELERICLKALAKRPSERYTTAKDLADDLRCFLDNLRQSPPFGEGPGRATRPENLLHQIWDSLDPHLQDAFSLAYNKKQREGSNRISTRDLFQALARVQDATLRTLLASLPPGALPDPLDASVGVERQVLQEKPLLSDCVEDSLGHFINSAPLPRKLSPVDLFVDIGKHGHGPSVARLRAHGITPEELERRVQRYGLSVVSREKS